MSATAVAPTAAGPGSERLGIHVQGLTKHFRRKNGDLVAAVDGVTLEIERGEFWVLLGPSGCGKTTLLRCIAGLEEPDGGELSVDGRPVYSRERRIHVPTERRGIGMVFQGYALWPHMNVRSNVAFPLTTGPRRNRPPRKEIDRRVREALELVGIPELIEQPVGLLSGGQQQRVSLARAIAAGNDVVLFDEPLSNVDAKVREQLRVEIRSLQRRLGFTALYVTHDQEEAMELADKIAVLSNGNVVQLGSADDIYNNPRTRYVAEFIGAANVIEGTLVRDAGGARVRTAIGEIAVATVPADLGDDVVVISRAHRWWVSTEPRQGENTWVGTVETIAHFGSHLQLTVKVGQQILKVWTDPEHVSTSGGAEVWVGVEPAACLLMGDA
ncbi:MAG: ABC transporter ATP-binding protein [Actinomycetota bacterium]